MAIKFIRAKKKPNPWETLSFLLLSLLLIALGYYLHSLTPQRPALDTYSVSSAP